MFIDTDIDNSFIVTNKKSDRVTKFPCDTRGLYVREYPEPATPTDCCVHNFNVSHVKGFTPREVKRARGVMKLYHDLNVPNIPSLKGWIR